MITIALLIRLVGYLACIVLIVWGLIVVFKKVIKSAILEALKEYHSQDDCE